MNYKVKQEDLKGDIKDFPIEVVQKMVDEQVRQGNKADVEVFQKVNWTSFYNGGFCWVNSRYGFDFWAKIIRLKDFDLLFSKYPKQSDLKEDNSKADKVVVKEKKATKRTFRKLSEVKLLVTNRNRKAVIAFLDEVCNEKNKTSNSDGTLNLFKKDCYLHFSDENINDWYCPSVDDAQYITGYKNLVKLRDIKRIHSREENRKQRELEKTKLFCETVNENVSHADSEVKKIEENTYINDETIERIRESINKEIKTNEELSKMINGKIEILEKREAQLISLSVRNSDLNTANEKLRDYNDVLENKVGKEKLFRNVFILMFIISFITLVAISLKY